MVTVVQKWVRRLMVIERTDAPWRRCCELGFHAAPGLLAVRWSTVQVLNTQENAALAHAVLALNIDSKTKRLQR